MKPVLDIHNLSIRFGTNTVVDNVSFSVKAGETLAIVGESGSGKSLSALSAGGLLPPSAAISGQVTVDGIEVTGASDREKRALRGNVISYIFQEPMTSLNPLHRVGKQIAESLKLHRNLRGQALHTEIKRLIDRVGLANRENIEAAYPHELSGGQRQRIMIAMALANGPRILVADEPTTALDATIEKQVLDLLKEIQADMGLALVFITHDLRLLRGFADRTIVMKAGKIIEANDTDRVLDAPENSYTQDLIAAGNMPARDDTPDEMPVLRAEKLSVAFEDRRGVLRRLHSTKTALAPIDFILRSGETLGLVGESGSGKTTMGLALMRLLSAQGRVYLEEQELSALDGKALRRARSDIQMVFQDPFGSLSPRMNVENIVAEGLEVHQPHLKADDRRARVISALEDTGLGAEHLERYPHEFSGGQRQRIAIARALILRPKLLILDEPTSALDRTVQKQIVDLLIDLQKKYGLAYLFISHDLGVVRAISHRVMVLRDGDLIEFDNVAKVFDAPAHEYTRTLVAAAKGH